MTRLAISAAAPAQAPGEWREGWPVVACTFAAMAIGALSFFTQGVFIGPLQHELGWTRTQISAAGFIQSTVCAIMAPFVGQALGRIGPRPMVLAGWTLAMASFGTLGLIGPRLEVFYLHWLLLAIGIAVGGPVALSAGLATWFSRHRGLAISMALNGVNVVGAIAPLAATALISGFGWRIAYQALAGGAFLVVFPLLLVWFHERRPSRSEQISTGAVPTGSRDEAGHGRAAARPAPELTLRQAAGMIRHRLFACGILLIGGCLVAQIVHFVPDLADRGVGQIAASRALSANSLVAILFGAFGGILLDRLPLPLVATGICVLPAISALILGSGTGNLAGAAVAAGLLGITSGMTVPLMSVYVARHVGMRHYGACFGAMMAMFNLAQGAGAVALSRVRDLSGDYSGGFFGVATVLLVAAVVMAFTGDR